MAKLVRCRDLGFDCDAEIRAETTEEAIQKVGKHAREVHGMDRVPIEIVDKVNQSIQDA